MIRTHYLSELEEGKVKVAGFVREVRDLGKIVFVEIFDKSGKGQLVFKPESTDFDKAKKLTKQSFVVAEGFAKKSEKSMTGWEIIPEKIYVNPAESPLPIDMENDTTGLSKRIEWRFLDLRREKIRKIFEFQSRLVGYIHEFMKKEGFTRLFFSRIVGESTEGGTEFFPIVYFDREAYLAQSPQLYKELALLSGLDRVYDLGFVYRAEPHHTTRHLCEYMSFDVEMVADELEDILSFEEKMMNFLAEKINSLEKDLMEEFGASMTAGKIPRMKLKEVNNILSGMDVEVEEGDITPEGERAIGKYVKEEYGTDFVFITHYPFAKKPFYIMRDGEDSFGFDLLFKGLEITSGGLREHRYDERVKNIREKGLNPDAYDDLRFYKYGMPPHGGFAIGIERLTEKILGLDNIREATLLPRDPTTLRP